MKRQFIHISTISDSQPPIEQAGAGGPQSEQTRPTPASQRSTDPSLQQASGTPHSPKEHPYLQAPQSLPGVPVLPSGMRKKVTLTSSSPLQGSPRQPSGGLRKLNQSAQAGKFVPSSFASGTNPVGNVPGPTNRLSNYWTFSSSGSQPNGNSPGFVGTLRPEASPNPPNPTPTLRSRATNPSLRSVLGNSYRPLRLRTDPLAPLEEPKPPQGKRKKPLSIWARIAIGLLVFLVIVTGGTFAYYETQIAPSLNNILGKSAIHHTSDGQTNGQNNTGTAPTGRTNILLLGSDTDGKGNDPNNGIPLAQTVMIVTVDPQTNFVGMLSIPRDMQVIENGHTEPKLDEVFSNGYTGSNVQDKVASGAGEMEDIIQYNFGIHIDHYAWVGLGGFIKVIDTAGGVDVDTIHPMVDDTYPDDVGNTTGSLYDYKRLYIAPGPQHLDGAQALDYVRTRHSDLVGDFGRTVRQQQIISELKTKLATPDTLGEATQLLNDLNGAVQTDMQLSDIIGLGNLARGINSNSVEHLTLGPPDYAVPNTTGDRPTNYLPRCENIVPAIEKMFNITSPNCIPQTRIKNKSLASTASSVTTSIPSAFNTAIAPQGSRPGGTGQNRATIASGSDSLTEGIRGMLDVLFATTFESFNAMQI